MMNVGVETSIGRVRETNEDSFWVGDGLLIVCDGMGGHQAGEVASKLAVDYIRGFKFLLSDPEEEIRQAILGAHKEIVDAAKQTRPSTAWVQPSLWLYAYRRLKVQT